ncbi:MAG: hypothetical protein PHV28_06790 [Kiritimatiellae bacterium]|nr:hypothetical protein [Kiritimatiellia bacterium]
MGNCFPYENNLGNPRCALPADQGEEFPRRTSGPFGDAAATLFLCGADAVYASVAHLSDAVLLTYDAGVIERISGTLRAMTPDTWLRQ